MKKIKQLLGLSVILLMISSCATVDSGHTGVAVSWGGETDLTQVYEEGLHNGIGWMFADMIQYNTKEKTVVQKLSFNDKDNMIVPIEFSVDFKIISKDANKLHKGIDDYMVKLNKTIKSAASSIIPKYSAVQINILKRNEIESKMDSVLKIELPEFYLDFVRIQMTDVDLPKAVSLLAEETAKQVGRNELSSKLKEEKENNAAALIAESKGKFEAAEFDVKTKKLMSQPAVLALYEAETDRQWAVNGVSRYGSNNIFGAGSPKLFKNLK
jgi:prohibitin 1